MKKMFLFLTIAIVCHYSYAQNKFPASGSVGIGTILPESNLHIFNWNESKPGGVVAPSISVLKLSRVGTTNHSYFESSEFRMGHGGPSTTGSRLDLYINGDGNTDNIPNQHAMSWLYNGNVGIGTPSPNALLQVGTPGLGGPSQRSLFQDGIGVAASGSRKLIYLFSDGEDYYGLNAYDYGTNSGLPISVGWSSSNVLIARNGGNVGIGTTNPSEKLTVNGKIRAKEIKVETGWSDFVFEPSYKLRSLNDTERYIKAHGHLPEIPSAKEVEKNGINVGEMNSKLLQKIEELTLHLIDQNKEIKALKEKIEKYDLKD